MRPDAAPRPADGGSRTARAAATSIPPAAVRRADWRYLLPAPPGGAFRHLVVLGGPPGLADRLADLGLAHRVASGLPPEPSADAVAVLQGAAVEPERAARCLAPGGAFYCEISRERSGSLLATPARLRRSLSRLGLRTTGVYAVRPDFATAEMYLPLDVEGTVRWYVSTRHVAWTPRQAALEAALRVVTRLESSRFARLLPRYALTATAGDSVAPPSILAHPTILTRLETRSRSEMPAELGRADLRPVLFTAGGNRVALLPYAPGAAHPSGVIKIPRLPQSSGRTEVDQAALEAVRGRLDEALRRAVPRPLGLLRWQGVTVAVESYLPGCSILRSSGRWGTSVDRKLDDLRLVAAWLEAFHTQARVRASSWSRERAGEYLARPLVDYRDAFGAGAREERLFALARERSESLIGSPLPVVWQHRDFTPWNLLRDDGELRVVDWEGFREGLPLCDLVHFATHWHEVARGLGRHPDRVRALRDLYVEPARGGRLSRAVQGALAGYMSRLEIDRRFLPLLLVCTWVELALRRLAHQRNLGETHEDARARNREVDYVMALAEHAERLFGAG